jgi:hypothetical protein
MVYGGVTTERIGLNEDTLWSGGPKDCDNPQALKTLPEVRRLIFEGKYAEAHQLGKKMMGPYTQTYLPMGDLVLTFEIPRSSGPIEIRDYRRMLDLDRGVADVRYTIDDVVYTRKLFVSQPDQILVVRLTASRPGTLGFTARLGSRLHFRTQAKDNILVLRGKDPVNVDPNYHSSPNPVVYATTDDGEGMSFECHLRASADEGTITTMRSGSSMPAPSRSCFRLPPVSTVATGRLGAKARTPRPSPRDRWPPRPANPTKISCALILKIISGCSAGFLSTWGHRPKRRGRCLRTRGSASSAPLIRAWWRCTPSTAAAC